MDNPEILAVAAPPATNLETENAMQGNVMPGGVANAMPGGMANAVPGAIRNVMPGAIGNAIPGAIGNAMPGAIGNAMPGAIGNAMPGAMGNAMPGAMGSVMPGVMGNAMPGTMWNTMPNAMGHMLPGLMGNMMLGNAMPGTAMPGMMNMMLPMNMLPMQNYGYSYMPMYPSMPGPPTNHRKRRSDSDDSSSDAEHNSPRPSPNVDYPTISDWLQTIMHDPIRGRDNQPYTLFAEGLTSVGILRLDDLLFFKGDQLAGMIDSMNVGTAMQLLAWAQTDKASIDKAARKTKKHRS
jgi:hypothetical protein